MDQKKLMQYLNGRSIQVPFSMLAFKTKKKLEWQDFIMLMYLKDRGKFFPLNPKEIEEDLGLNQKEVMFSIGALQEAKLLRMEVKKNDKGIMEDFICLDDFYDAYMMEVLDSIQKKSVISSNIFETIEKEFGRTLSPMELEIIKAWLEEGFKEEVIEEAIKEAIFNGVSNLRYIDKILYEWDKKGIKSRKDVENRKTYHKSVSKEPVEVFEYNWFEDDEIDE